VFGSKQAAPIRKGGFIFAHVSATLSACLVPPLWGELLGVELSTFVELPVHMGLGSLIAGLKKARAQTSAIGRHYFY